MWLRRLAIALVLVISVFAISDVFIAPQPAAAEPGICVPGMPCSLKPILGEAVDDVISGISNWVADNTVKSLGWAFNKFEDISNVRKTIRNAGLLHAYERQMGIALFVLVPMLIAATLQALFKGSSGSLIRLYFIQLPVAILGGFVAIFFVDSMMLFMDKMTLAVTPDFTKNMQTVVETISASALLLAPIGLLVFVFGGVFLIIAVLALGIELVARDVMISTTMIFIPMAFAGMVWPITAPWLQKTIRIILSLGFVKFVMIALLSVGVLVIQDQLLDSTIPDAALKSLPFEPIKAAELDSACRSSTINGVPDRPNTGLKYCVTQKVGAHKGLSAYTTALDGVCKLGVSPEQEATMDLTARNAVKTKYFTCFETQTGLYSTVPDIQQAIQDSGIISDELTFNSMTNVISGLAIFFTAALSPAIAFKIFDVFEGGIEQIRYAPNNARLSPVGRTNQIVAGASVADILTKGNKVSGFINN